VLPEERARTLEEAARIMAGQPRVGFVNRYRHKDGRPVHIMWSARWSEADQLRIGVARDVTAQQRSEAMQAATYAVSEAAHDAVDLDTLFPPSTPSSPSWCRWPGWWWPPATASPRRSAFPTGGTTAASPSSSMKRWRTATARTSSPPAGGCSCRAGLAPTQGGADAGGFWLVVPLIDQTAPSAP
jgi:hypothetical protein